MTTDTSEQFREGNTVRARDKTSRYYNWAGRIEGPARDAHGQERRGVWDVKLMDARFKYPRSFKSSALEEVTA